MNAKSRTYKRLIELLRDYAPDYALIETMGPRVLPHLRRIIGVEEALMAGKAAYVAARIASIHTPPLIDAALAREEPGVHVAALLGVRSVALRTGKFEKRQASRKHRNRLLKFVHTALGDKDSGITRIAEDARMRFEAAERKNDRKK